VQLVVINAAPRLPIKCPPIPDIRVPHKGSPITKKYIL